MRGKRPADQADPAAEVDDGGEDVVAGAAVQRPLVEIVDLALDDLDEEVVAHQHLVDERRDEVAGGEVAEARLPIDAGTEPDQSVHRSLVDGQDDVATREEVDLATDQARGCGVIGLHRFERDVEQLSGMCEPRAAVVVLQPLDVGVGQTERVQRLGERVLFLTGIDVDPKQSLRPERPDDLLGQLDATVMGIRIEQPDGGVAQCTELSRIAAATATKATRYCSASIVRSSDGSTSQDLLGLVARSKNIDIGPRCDGKTNDRRHRAVRHHAPGSAFGA